MFGSQILDVAIGIVFVYLLLSLVCSSIREAIESVLKTRAVNLEQGLREMLQDDEGTGLAQAIYKHPLIDGLFRGSYDPSKIKKGRYPRRSTLPSYIPSDSFARALLDIIVRGKDPADAAKASAQSSAITLDSVRTNIASLSSPLVQRAVLQALDTAVDLPALRANLESWFNSTMDRISGWYKRDTQLILFLLGLGATIAVNANTITIAGYLYSNKAARDALSDSAAAHAAAHDTSGTAAQITDRLKQLSALDLPLGWSKPWPGPKIKGLDDINQWFWPDFLSPALGWLLTAFAISLGAPFWFDMLNKVMSARATTKPATTTPATTTPTTPPPPGGAAPQPAAVTSDTASFVPRQWATGDPHEGDG